MSTGIPLAQKLQPDRVALLVVDMCNDFVHPDGKTAARAHRPIGHAVEAIPTIARLIEGARAAGALVAFIQHTTLPGGLSDSPAWTDARSRATYSVPDICLDGSWGQAIVDDLAPADGDAIVKKYRYSGFAGTELDLVLRSGGRETTVCCGVSTNVCVEATAREAFSHEYFVVLPEDGCASWDRPLHEATLESAGKRYAEVTSVDSILDIWQGGGDR